MLEFEPIDDEVLSTVGGGVTSLLPTTPQPRERGDEPRTWGQVGREYAAACVQGAAQSMMFGGMPRNGRAFAGQAAFGCAMGVGMKLVDDVTGAMAGDRR
jgi:hypothetical protein